MYINKGNSSTHISVQFFILKTRWGLQEHEDIFFKSREGLIFLGLFNNNNNNNNTWEFPYTPVWQGYWWIIAILEAELEAIYTHNRGKDS